jgi:hypothetical protein
MKNYRKSKSGGFQVFLICTGFFRVSKQNCKAYISGNLVFSVTKQLVLRFYIGQQIIQRVDQFISPIRNQAWGEPHEIFSAAVSAT